MADLTQLKHIVVLMMENRSFDHMLGFLKKENPDLRGVLGNDYSNPSNAGPDVPVTDGAEYEGQLIIDPGHDFTDVYMQMYGVPFGSAPSQPDMSGFARSYEQMGAWAPTSCDVFGRNRFRCSALWRESTVSAINGSLRCRVRLFPIAPSPISGPRSDVWICPPTLSDQSQAFISGSRRPAKRQ